MYFACGLRYNAHRLFPKYCRHVKHPLPHSVTVCSQSGILAPREIVTTASQHVHWQWFHLPTQSKPSTRINIRNYNLQPLQIFCNNYNSSTKAYKGEFTVPRVYTSKKWLCLCLSKLSIKGKQIAWTYKTFEQMNFLDNCIYSEFWEYCILSIILSRSISH